ncbi:ACP S-malonyltransferase [Tessaracoccus oleiagri]|uniref:[acyl-carrier-protein] S-malonyltransferase n=1 Tax=Tessaracoccus oleiagri TaxID=686624 RepID=A0A1G9LWC0_9ACTN|nr:ACP S-malonyltransferase [Tessaracoccus oleiagri]SDL66114.1 [acyl-carrier-protein] S-malonyltransferase [Tessaracoccus oleiagri]
MLAIVAPGQGAQTPGFLSPWLESEEFAATLAGLSEAADLDLARYGTEADADTIRDTAIAQPLLVAAGIATARALDAGCDVVAGHSVGELAATALAGVLSETEAMRLVAVRGRAMAEASAARPTSMTAIVGGQVDEVLAAIEAAGLTPANNNGPGQIVAAGTVEQLQQLAENAPRRARLVPLSVAGAFHTVHMAPAVDALREVAAAMTPADPQVRILSNRDGAVVERGQEVLERLVNQVANPVRWDLCMDTLRELGVTGLLELTPAGTLTGIAKRNLKDVELFNLNTPDQLDDARAFAAQHHHG